MSLYLPDAATDNRANKTLWSNTARAFDVTNIRAFGAGVISGLTVDSAGSLQIGEAIIGHVVAVMAPISLLTATATVITALTASALNYVYLQPPPMPVVVPATGNMVGVVGSDGRDAAQIVCNTSGVAPSAYAALIATVQTGSGNSITTVNNAPTGRVNLILPSVVQAQIAALKTRDLFYNGSMPTQTGLILWRVPSPLVISLIKAYVGTAPAGASQVYDLKKNGVSIFSTTGNRLTIAAGANTGVSATADNGAACVEGDIISLDVTQAGSTTAAANLAATIYYV